MSFGPLSTLGTGRTAGGLVIGVDAESGLDHHYTVMSSVFTVLIYKERDGKREGLYSKSGLFNLLDVTDQI